MNDDRPVELKEGHYVISGLEELLALSVPRPTYAPMPVKKPLAVGESETLSGAEPYAVRLRAAQN